MDVAYGLLDKGFIPDFLLRPAIRSLCRQKIQEINAGSFEANHAKKMEWIAKARARESIAEQQAKANEQHYEVSTKFMMSCLGPQAKYSACLYPTGKETLAEAETLMLESYCDKARLQDGMDILDLGCGWGSLSLFLARKYPNSKITGLSNSKTQKSYIDARAAEEGLHNFEIVTGDVAVFDFRGSKSFDRILSIEMFEHMKNYAALMRKISTWLKPDSEAFGDESLFFVHIFCHKSMPYDFIDDDSWMSRTFFSGGTMPSHDLLLFFQDDLVIERSWFLNGRHYSQTCEDWLRTQDAHAKEGLRELESDAEAKGVGSEEGRKSFYRFRVFFMACAEFFALNGGEEWGVGHYLFRLPKAR